MKMKIKDLSDFYTNLPIYVSDSKQATGVELDCAKLHNNIDLREKEIDMMFVKSEYIVINLK